MLSFGISGKKGSKGDRGTVYFPLRSWEEVNLQGGTVNKWDDANQHRQTGYFQVEEDVQGAVWDTLLPVEESEKSYAAVWYAHSNVFTCVGETGGKQTAKTGQMRRAGHGRAGGSGPGGAKG